MGSHETLELTKVNLYGLVYLWKGTDESLKPLMLTAHQGKNVLIFTILAHVHYRCYPRRS